MVVATLCQGSADGDQPSRQSASWQAELNLKHDAAEPRYLERTAKDPASGRNLSRKRVQCVVIQSRASRCAAAISVSDISSATSRRIRTASERPLRAARLNHLCAAIRLTTPERPLDQ